MSKLIVNKIDRDYQLLISIGIELVHSVLSLEDCNPELAKTSHYKKVKECANKWNETFFNVYINSKAPKSQRND